MAEEPSLLLQNMRELKSELNHRNTVALQELNRDIDQLATQPTKDLPPYQDRLSGISPPAGYKHTGEEEVRRNVELLDSHLDQDLTMQLQKDLEEFKEFTISKNSNLNSNHEYEIEGHEKEDIMTFKQEMDYRDELFNKSMSAFTTKLKEIPSAVAAASNILSNGILNQSESQFQFRPDPRPDPRPEPRPEPQFQFQSRPDPQQQPQSQQQQNSQNNSLLYNSIKKSIAQMESPKPIEPSYYDPIATQTTKYDPIATQTTKFGQKQQTRFELDSGTDSKRATENDDGNMAIINALRTLQDRVGKLESEKTQAKEKIQGLENELGATRKLLLHQQNLQTTAYPDSPTKSHDSKPAASPIHQSENNIINIKDAREKVALLKDRFEHVRNLAKGSASNQMPSENETGGQKSHTDSSRHANVDVLDLSVRHDPAFDNILQKHSLELLRESKLDHSRKQQAEMVGIEFGKNGGMGREESSVGGKKAWGEEENISVRSESPQKHANDQMKRLQRDIDVERQSRRSENSLVTSVIKKKVLDKIKSTSALPTKKKVADTDPVWKTRERSRSTVRDATISSSAHLRKRAPIEVPAVTGASEENGGREMPFIIGKNTGKSFSVTANLQRVFSLLKSHNPEMCTVCSKRHPPNTNHPTKESDGRTAHVLDSHDPVPRKQSKHKQMEPVMKQKIAVPVSQPRAKANEKEENPSNESLFQILGILEQEFKDSKTQYNQLVKQYEIVAESMTSREISESTGATTLKAIGDDLRNVIQTMEAKSDQIAIIRDILTTSLTIKKPRKKSSVPKQASYTTHTASSRSRSREVGGQADWTRNRMRSQSPGRAMASLSLLKSSLKVQDALV